MNILQKIVFITSISLPTLTNAEPKEIKQKILSGEKATTEINKFITERRERQIWQIEFKDLCWHVKNTDIWVINFVPARYLGNQTPSTLKGLNKEHVYEFEGTPVDLCYNFITFYVRSIPKKIIEQSGTNQPDSTLKPKLKSKENSKPERRSQ